MNRGVGFSLKSLFQPFLIGTIMAFILDYVILFIENNVLNLNIIKFDIYPVVLVCVFFNVIFIKNNILNYLFINGCSRKEINSTKTVSNFIYILIYFIFILVIEFFFGEMLNDINLYKVLRLITIYVSLNLAAEFAMFLTLLYRKISIEKGKGVKKVFYRYSYSMLFIIIVYVCRYLHRLSYFSEYFNNNIVIGSILLFCVIMEFVFLLINKKYILKIDVRV